MEVYQISIVDPFHEESVETYLNNHPEASLFHSVDWARVLTLSYHQLKPRFLVVTNKKDQVRGVLPLFKVESPITGQRLVSLPFTLYAGALADLPEVEQLLYQNAIEYLRVYNAQYLEIRTTRPYLPQKQFKHISSYVNHVLDLQGELGVIYKRFSRSNVRQHLQKLEKLPVKVTARQDREALKIFYRLYLFTRKKIGLPPQPFSFFKFMREVLVPKGKMNIYLAESNGRFIGTILVLYSRQVVHMEYSGIDYNAMELKPTFALFWQVIQDAHARRFRSVEFGGSPISHQTLRRFKNHWGAREEPLYHHFYPEVRGISGRWEKKNGTQFIQKIVRLTPQPVLSQMGKIIFRHLGG